jgi:hypothetical protein
MTTTVEAVYQGGVFKPIRPVDLPENQRVTIVVETDTSPHRGGPVEQGPGSAPGPRSLKDLVGRVPLSGPPPTDEDIDRMREEALREKFGR